MRASLEVHASTGTTRVDLTAINSNLQNVYNSICCFYLYSGLEDMLYAVLALFADKFQVEICIASRVIIQELHERYSMYIVF